jgi:hypothetical protein
MYMQIILKDFLLMSWQSRRNGENKKTIENVESWIWH